MSLELIWKNNGNNNLQIQLVPSTLLINTEMQKKIDDNWNDFMNKMNSKGIKAWNGRKYRVESIQGNVVKLSDAKIEKKVEKKEETKKTVKEEKSKTKSKK